MIAPQVLLATCRDHEEGEPAHELLDAAFAERGISSRWAVWDDPFVDWAAASVVAVRSTWDYVSRLQDFLGWAGSIGPSLLHGVEVFRWNTDKAYLVELADLSSVPVVPTIVCENPVELRAAVATFGTAVVKPRVGAGGHGIVIVYDAEAWLPVDAGPWVVQPLMETVHHEGEVSVFMIGGHPVSQLRKVAGQDDIRVHPRYGGSSYDTPLTHEAALLAAGALAAATEITGHELVYARVDLMRHEGQLLVSEIEVTEPGLYLDLLPENAGKFADAVAARR